MSAHVLALVLPLVEKGPDPSDVKPGWLGFGMFLALAVATTLLWLSFRKQLKKVNFEVETDDDQDDQRDHAGEESGRTPES